MDRVLPPMGHKELDTTCWTAQTCTVPHLTSPQPPAWGSSLASFPRLLLLYSFPSKLSQVCCVSCLLSKLKRQGSTGPHLGFPSLREAITSWIPSKCSFRWDGHFTSFPLLSGAMTGCLGCVSILVFLPGESHGQRSLVGYRPWSHKESDMTEQVSLTHY